MGKKERWKDVPGWPYRISDRGRVWSVKRHRVPRGRFLTPRYNNKGGVQMRFMFEGRDWQPRVHRLVAEAFLKRPRGATVVVHLDGNIWNNRADNLKWTTKREASIHANKKRWEGKRKRKDTGEKKGVA